MKNIFLKLFVFIAIIGLAFMGCKKEEFTPLSEIDSKNTQNELGLAQVRCEKSILIFDNQEHFDSVKKELDTFDDKQLSIWEKNIGFISTYSIFNEIMDAEASLSDYYDSLPEEDIRKLETTSAIYEYSDITKSYLKKGFIKTVKNNGDEYLRLTSFADYNSKVINEQGLVKIGNEIWQFSENQIKIIEDGDFNKIGLLKNTKSANQGIRIINLLSNTTTFKSYTIDYDWDGENTYDKKKIVATQRFIQYYTNSSHTIFHSQFWASISLYKYSWRKWRARKDDAFISGWYKWDDGATVRTSYESHNFSGTYFYSHAYINSTSSVSVWVHAPKIVSTHLKYDRYGGPQGIHVWCYNFSTGRLF